MLAASEPLAWDVFPGAAMKCELWRVSPTSASGSSFCRLRAVCKEGPFLRRCHLVA